MLSEPDGITRSLERQTGLSIGLSWDPERHMCVIAGVVEASLANLIDRAGRGTLGEISVIACGDNPKAARRLFLELNLGRLRRLKMIEQKGRCRLCSSTGPLQLDHINSRAKGRDDRPENTQLLCDPCHGRKTGRLQWAPRQPQPAMVNV